MLGRMAMAIEETMAPQHLLLAPDAPAGPAAVIANRRRDGENGR